MRGRSLVETFRVGLLITERCNVECDHCWFESGPDRKSAMSFEDIRGYIDQAREISTVEWISFTGGEPFLHPGLLESSVKYASERGLRSECVTNCYWADTERMAEGTLEGLVGAGLDVINISADDFHQRHIPFERVRNCFNAARALGVKIAIMCAVAKSSALRAKDVKRHLGDRGIQIIGAGKPKPTAQAIIIETGFTPVGRGAEIPEEEWMIGESPGGPCSLVLRDIGISPSGRVLPCCSAASLVEEACLGNAKEESLDEIIEHASRRPLFIALSTEGPSVLAQRLGLKETSYVDRCHLCHGVLTNPGLDRILPD
jgi:MoaA/NifB/PqqE/SkfB family radical SAM enzyme